MEKCACCRKEAGQALHRATLVFIRAAASSVVLLLGRGALLVHNQSHKKLSSRARDVHVRQSAVSIHQPNIGNGQIWSAIAVHRQTQGIEYLPGNSNKNTMGVVQGRGRVSGRGTTAQQPAAAAAASAAAAAAASVQSKP